MRAGRQRIALLKEGDAIKLDAGVAHRIHQHGMCSSTAGAVLWPGSVEQAFRELAVMVGQSAYRRSDMVDILARYEVFWTTDAHERDPRSVIVRPFRNWLEDLPEALARQLELRWGL